MTFILYDSLMSRNQSLPHLPHSLGRQQSLAELCCTSRSRSRHFTTPTPPTPHTLPIPPIQETALEENMSYLEIITKAGNIVPINNSSYYLAQMLQIQVHV